MKTIVVLVSIIFFISCSPENEGQIAKKQDYNAFLKTAPSGTTSKYFELWNSKIKPDSAQLLSLGKVASEYGRFFKETGNITYLKKAEKALVKATEIANVGKAGYRRALARNYISQHRFKEALRLAEEAQQIGGGRAQTRNLLFDIHMELGNYTVAEKYLDSIRNMSDFDYLIRLSKWNDYKGDLDTTIKFMERAKTIAETSKNKGLMLWSFTNLADYYGHAGRIKDSYDHYLKALALDENNAYAKKGIAWIVYSHDKNPTEALRILDAITKTYDAPDYHLLKAEIADYMGNEPVHKSNLDNYFLQVEKLGYGDMYNGYTLDLYLEETKQYGKAMEIAKQEVSNRPTPESYSWLAYTYYKIGDIAKAQELMDAYVDGKTLEPGLLYKAAEVYKANGKFNKVKEIKEELMGALYELGPSMREQIHKL
ncbi:tetratricopeptide repeat protein [Maribacter sp. 2210JD10-5]|uniref:tetratricopeptide repeat protein n=1 Tax=Maribacter sp. 2210JD10-5 TaxID=3386272 RepID=UPI0039BCD228